MSGRKKRSPWRTGALLVGAGTAVYFARSMRMVSRAFKRVKSTPLQFTQFTHARDIPVHFLRGQVRLRGRIQGTLEDGRLRVLVSVRPLSF